MMYTQTPEKLAQQQKLDREESIPGEPGCGDLPVSGTGGGADDHQRHDPQYR